MSRYSRFYDDDYGPPPWWLRMPRRNEDEDIDPLTTIKKQLKALKATKKFLEEEKKSEPKKEEKPKGWYEKLSVGQRFLLITFGGPFVVIAYMSILMYAFQRFAEITKNFAN